MPKSISKQPDYKLLNKIAHVIIGVSGLWGIINPGFYITLHRRYSGNIFPVFWHTFFLLGPFLILVGLIDKKDKRTGSTSTGLYLVLTLGWILLTVGFYIAQAMTL